MIQTIVASIPKRDRNSRLQYREMMGGIVFFNHAYTVMYGWFGWPLLCFRDPKIFPSRIFLGTMTGFPQKDEARYNKPLIKFFYWDFDLSPQFCCSPVALPKTMILRWPYPMVCWPSGFFPYSLPRFFSPGLWIYRISFNSLQASRLSFFIASQRAFTTVSSQRRLNKIRNS